MQKGGGDQSQRTLSALRSWATGPVSSRNMIPEISVQYVSLE